MKTINLRKLSLIFACLLASMLLWPGNGMAKEQGTDGHGGDGGGGGGGGGGRTTYSGQAVVVRANVAGLPQVVLADTGPLPPNGGSRQASLVNAQVPGLLTAEALSASTVGQGGRSRSQASIANLTLTVGANIITASSLTSRAEAVCNGRHASVSGSSTIGGLTINGQSITVTGEPNQTISLPTGGRIVINEQTSSVRRSYGTITVNGLHVTIPNVADVVIASSHSDIGCQCR